MPIYRDLNVCTFKAKRRRFYMRYHGKKTFVTYSGGRQTILQWTVRLFKTEITVLYQKLVP